MVRCLAVEGFRIPFEGCSLFRLTHSQLWMRCSAHAVLSAPGVARLRERPGGRHADRGNNQVPKHK